MHKYLILALATLAACGDTKGDSGGTDTGTTIPAGGPEILGWDPACTDSETFEASANISGATDQFGLLNIWETGAPDASAWNEEHDLVDGNILLTQVSSAGDVGDNGDGTGTSLFGCGTGEQFDLDETTLTYAVRIYDVDGNFADCIAFGHEPSTVSGGTYTTIGGNPSAPAELEGCRTL